MYLSVYSVLLRMGVFFYHVLNVGLEHFRVKLALEASCGTECIEGLFINRQKAMERRRPWSCVIHAAERKRKSSKTEPPWVPSSPRISLETSNRGNTANRASLASLWNLTGFLVSTWIVSIRGNVDLTMGLGQPYSYGPDPLGTKESALLDDICQLGLWGWEII